MTEISLSRLAKQLICSPGSLTRLVKIHTIELLPSGKVDREKALEAISKTSGAGGGWSGIHRGRPGLHERAEKLLDTPKRRRRKAGTPDDGPFPPSFALGMAFLAARLGDKARFDALCELTVELGVTPKQAREAVLLFVVMSSVWIQDLLAESLGKKYAQKFDQQLGAWITAFNKSGAKNASD